MYDVIGFILCKLSNDLLTYRGYFGSILGCIEVDTPPHTNLRNVCMNRALLGDTQQCVGSRFFLRILLTRFAQCVPSLLVAFLTMNCFPFCIVLWRYSFATFIINCYCFHNRIKVFNFIVLVSVWVWLNRITQLFLSFFLCYYQPNIGFVVLECECALPTRALLIS